MVAMLLVAGVSALAQQVALAPDSPCPTEEPDTVQISWNQPCEEGNWLLDTQAGCRMWDWHPEQTDRAHWTGGCKAGAKDGKGVVQWFEHGLPIDRFEGAYVAGKREGQGRYEWNDNDRYIGTYAQNVPHGHGSITLAGETLTGEWQHGCLKAGDRVIAVGVPRSSCEFTPLPKDQLARN
jgi:hypothetical protein